ncbi:hypothetical protein [Stenotrophomonas sp. RG-453]|uniref:hypothetical protein n=1 Tax=Stenotrophomonas sp. RG-453 TaxID=2957502 RepID=UPI0029CA11F4|nr:hypothetical protein [Stenotrophomonas sp. RG-453]MDX5517788.1 hypothetical protein [Stenotrophomonas sp. RG-453]
MQNGTGFSLVAIDAAVPPTSLSDLDYLSGAYRVPEGGYLPGSFRFSPFTGQPLERRPVEQWRTPFGGDDGGRSCSASAAEPIPSTLQALFDQWQRSGQSMQDAAEVIKSPQPSGLFFFSSRAGGHRNGLFAASRSGQLSLWQHGHRHWVPLTPRGASLGRSHLETWANATLTLPHDDGHEVIMATDSGADCVSVDAMTLSYQIDRAVGRSLGAPGLLDDAAFVPQEHEGQWCLAIRRTGEAWQQLVLTLDAPLQLLAAPISDPAHRSLFWIGTQGVLSVRLDGQGDVYTRWQSWPEGYQATPVLGPPYRDGEGFWQLLYDTRDKKWLLTRLDTVLPEQRPAPRGYTSTGRTSFQFNVRLERPWDEFDHDLYSVTHVVYPFLEVVEPGLMLSLHAPLPQQRSLLSFFESQATVHATFCLERIGGHAYTYAMDTPSPWNAQWFVHDEALWLWVDARGTLLRWSLPQ